MRARQLLYQRRELFERAELRLGLSATLFLCMMSAGLDLHSWRWLWGVALGAVLGYALGALGEVVRYRGGD